MIGLLDGCRKPLSETSFPNNRVVIGIANHYYIEGQSFWGCCGEEEDEEGCIHDVHKIRDWRLNAGNQKEKARGK